MDRPQFDILLGGGEELPQDFSLMEFASARAQEIISIGEALQEPRRTGLVFQRLPRHMRRRIMSHNTKRMPRQLREAHQRQMEKGGLPPKSKRPSRKYRRRPSNLLEAYNRRQKENVWLETHIWHAKRFHMIKKWGYKLPHFPNDKSSRACYRGAANHCLLQDISYYVCIELAGSFESIINGLRMVTRPECGLTFRAKLWCKGDREGSVMLFHSDSKYPHGAIGRVNFVWKPLGGPGSEARSEAPVKGEEDMSDDIGSSEDSGEVESFKKVDSEDSDANQQRKLWLWVHPSYYGEIKEELVKVFKFQQCPAVNGEGSQEEPPHKRQKSDKSKSDSKESPETGGESYGSSHQRIGCDQIVQFFGSNITMSLLKDTLVRLRLTGPLSHAVLREALAPVPPMRDGDPPWWGSQWEDVFEHQKQLWEELSAITSPANVSPHMVLGLAILDPRGNLPQKRTKAVDLETIIKNEVCTRGLPLSPIWDPQTRDIVTSSKPSDAQVNRRRSENLVPGLTEAGDVTSASSENGDLSPRLPILLIQRPGSRDPIRKRLGYGSGWDLIAPGGWGKPLWIAMVMRGARAAGLREAEVLGDAAVSRECNWPAPPDTRAGQVEMSVLELEAKEKYFRLPPSKRPNYIRLGISSPFSFPWSILCQEWSPSPVDATSGMQPSSSCSFYVLRSPHKLEKMSKALHDLQRDKSSGDLSRAVQSHQPSVMAGGKSSLSLNEILGTNGDSEDVSGCCLVPVKVTICEKGTVAKHALICLPLEEDFSGEEGNRSQGLKFKGPVEPNNPDPYREERAKARKEHKEELRKLRRKRVKMRKEADEEASPLGMVVEESEATPKRPPMGPKVTEEMCAHYRKRMEELFLPAVFNARNSCSREVAGYVVSGGFSFSEAREMGYGYVALPAMDCLIKTKGWNKKLLVFVRNTSSTHYFPASIEIVTN
ncbi:ribonucleases P/MRP protein subunit POP1 [Hetaerina americana]|uniref:ribonucleases P/MRP protein subunit POP1 n=1 Tax=Hetaerina americana TaxID=62018 RepID=UPI003A7F5FBB